MELHRRSIDIRVFCARCTGPSAKLAAHTSTAHGQRTRRAGRPTGPRGVNRPPNGNVQHKAGDAGDDQRGRNCLCRDPQVREERQRHPRVPPTKRSVPEAREQLADPVDHVHRGCRLDVGRHPGHVDGQSEARRQGAQHRKVRVCDVSVLY